MPEAKTLDEQIKSINTKVQLLLKKLAALEKENSILSGELDDSKAKEIKAKEKINNLELETSILKASAGKMDEKEKIVFDKQINQYIKNLEKCMTMLNK